MIERLLLQGEGRTVEYKQCRKKLNKDVYDSVCALLNRDGGHILLGVDDEGCVVGIDQERIQQIKKDFVTTINNGQKIAPPAYLHIEEKEWMGRHILLIHVPESAQVHRCNGRIYDRNEDGDLNITNHTQAVAQLYMRKQTRYTENTIYPHADVADLDTAVLQRCRKMAVQQRANHPWHGMSDMELLKSARLYQKNLETGAEGLTQAAILLLGKTESILSILPHHRTDLLLRRQDTERYDDRDFVDTHLIDSFDRIMAFVRKHLNDPFFLEDTQRISLRDTIFREVAVNLLIHREYSQAFPAKLIISKQAVHTENSNRPHGMGVLNLHDFTPIPKNPILAHFFREIGLAEELGSGMRKLHRYAKHYGGSAPTLTEGDIFRVHIPIPMVHQAHQEAHEQAHHEAHQNKAPPVLTDIEKKILAHCRTQPRSTQSILQHLGYSSRTGNVKRAIKNLMALQYLTYTIPAHPRSKNQQYTIGSGYPKTPSSAKPTS